MTLKRLNDFRKENIALRLLEEEIEILADSIPGGNNNGIPSAKGGLNSKENKYYRMLEEKEKLEKRRDKLLKEHSDTSKYIESIKDPTTYMIFRYHFIKGYSWTKVAMKIGGKNTGDTVRMHVKRYLEDN